MKGSIYTYYSNFPEYLLFLADYFKNHAQLVDSSSWQSVSDDKGRFKTMELMNHTLKLTMPETMEQAQEFIKPDLPWAEDHFQERVGGLPLNPGKQYLNWRFYKQNKSNDKFRHEGEKFSHSYMERIWCRTAGDYHNDSHFIDNTNAKEVRFNKGIRYNYGDFFDVVRLLLKDPNTRQAYLPIFFPEDTGNVSGVRIPCSLGYHFIMRQGKLHCNYFMRSTDILRHFKDDIYLAIRKTQWLLKQLRDLNSEIWDKVEIGDLYFFTSSLHCFEQEINVIKLHLK